MMLELEALTHRYGDETALEDVSLGIEAGNVLGLLGPSGSGKTTVVQAVAGHVAPSAGQVHLRGTDVTTDPPETRDVGVVFQEPTLFPHMTVAENVAYGLAHQGIDGEKRDTIVSEYLDLVSLADQRDSRPSALSGGQKRRAELARALAPEPDVLLLDEPLSGLDRALRERLREEIAHIQRETGVTTLYVTHDQETAMALADRLVVLTAGRVAAAGPPRDLYESPPTPFVASFLGQSTRLPITVDPDGGLTAASTALAMDGGECLSDASQTVRSRGPAAGPHSPGRSQVECLARPAAIDIRDPEATSEDVCLPGVVTRVTDFGTHYEVTIHLDAGDELTVEQRSNPPATGERVTATVAAEDVMVFEA